MEQSPVALLLRDIGFINGHETGRQAFIHATAASITLIAECTRCLKGSAIIKRETYSQRRSEMGYRRRETGRAGRGGGGGEREKERERGGGSLGGEG